MFQLLVLIVFMTVTPNAVPADVDHKRGLASRIVEDLGTSQSRAKIREAAYFQALTIKTEFPEITGPEFDRRRAEIERNLRIDIEDRIEGLVDEIASTYSVDALVAIEAFHSDPAGYSFCKAYASFGSMITNKTGPARVTDQAETPLDSLAAANRIVEAMGINELRELGVMQTAIRQFLYENEATHLSSDEVRELSLEYYPWAEIQVDRRIAALKIQLAKDYSVRDLEKIAAFQTESAGARFLENYASYRNRIGLSGY